MRRLIVGILAHVDAGKTTLAESMLYHTGRIRKIGRVDHKDTFLDTHELERNRGITIFAKQAVFLMDNLEITLLDTPGHVDFSTEMERTLQVLDYAILVISGSDGIQGYTETLWKLLEEYKIPTFIFINKMDLDGTDQNIILEELKKRIHDGCVNFNTEPDSRAWMENIAMCDEALLDKYIHHYRLDKKDIMDLIVRRRVFPCYFGSALRLQGIEDLLQGIERYTIIPSYQKEFGAKIYKIARDAQGNRLTFMKITGGSLKVKKLLTNQKNHRNNQSSLYEKDTIWEEKVDQIRIYSGNKYESIEEAEAGRVCAVTGLNYTYPGESLGIEKLSIKPILSPVLNYRILLPPEIDSSVMLSKLRLLEEEDPQLHILWLEQLKEIHVQLMGEIQKEILKSIILERFGIEVEFGTGNIVYKETIIEPIVGMGHFEPLRHYAEVHLLLEPDERGSGLSFASSCSEDILDRNWQRLILTHMAEKEHVGVLTGSPITDMKITLIAGRSHQKHTEGGDFREATYRGIRQGLKSGKSVLLEPYYDFQLDIPSTAVGRAMSDIGRMHGEFEPPQIQGEKCIIIGHGPVVTMNGYQTEVNSYTSGRGRFYCTFRGYDLCHNAEEVIEELGYDSEMDRENPTSSIFCTHGTGYMVEWDRVKEYIHLDSGWRMEGLDTVDDLEQRKREIDSKAAIRNSLQEEKELEEIFTRTYGPIKQRHNLEQRRFGYEKKKEPMQYQSVQSWGDRTKKELIQDYLLVDGYNIIFAWEELRELAQENLDAARYKLIDILCNYQAFKKCILILVFDAYKVKGGVGTIQEYHNIHVVYTKEAETADAYIEKTVHKIARQHRVVVATSDALEQLIIMGQGAARLSANDLKEEINRIQEQIRQDYMNKPSGRNVLGNIFGDTLQEFIREEISQEESQE